jgi:hypothetical protein
VFTKAELTDQGLESLKGQSVVLKELEHKTEEF